MIEIDPDNLNELSKPLMRILLASTNDPLFGQGVHYVPLYSNLLPEGENQVTIPVLVKKAFLAKPSKHYPGEFTLDIFSDQIGSGTFAKVYNSEGKVKSRLDFKFIKRENDKEAVIKALRYTEEDRKKITKEAQRASLGDAIKCKPPLFSNQWAFLVMSKAKGIPLSRVIDKMKIGEINPTLRQMILATKSILMQVDTVQQKKYGHRDIKPANILLDLPNGKATLVDFAFAKELKHPQTHCKTNKGTPLYLAPEVYRHGYITSQCDDYSAGLCLAELWGDTLLDLISISGDAKRLYRRNREETFKDLYARMNLSETAKILLDTLIYGLTRYNPKYRLTSKDGIALCDQLLQEAHLDELIYTPPTPEEREQEFEDELIGNLSDCIIDIPGDCDLLGYGLSH
ncbi:protein kinase domain-containing protein [Legionella quinlivanii]|uniref:protein kinase domain-containing protein n=1 Tax=Legionella quinlivanii TaxID=45073 RepID=UPI0022435197|nr:protein kinase [Legionella quinlivanii]MCW8450161.1 protein kinase [Legionella quinlivanii]